MKDTDRFIVAAAIAGLVWWLYTRQKGLTLAGQPENPMLLPAAPDNHQSLVTPSDSTGTGATNVFSAIGSALQTFARTLGAGPGNAPHIPSASSTISSANVGNWGLQVRPNEPAPGLATNVPLDDSLDYQTPFWSWGYPMATGVAAMPWTLNPAVLGYDPTYIPPPPGS